MARSSGIVTLVIGLVASAVLFATQWSGTGSPTPPKGDGNAIVNRANETAAQATQQLAERALAAYQATSGSFDGASLSGIPGATLRAADAQHYCLEISQSGSVFYDAGPGGTLTTTPCS